MDPFSIRVHKPFLFHPNFCLLFVAYMEELKKTMVMVMFPNLYIPLLSYYSVQFGEKTSKGYKGQTLSNFVKCCETRIAIYVGLLVHNTMESADLVHALFQLGLYASRNQKEFGNQICEEFLKNGSCMGLLFIK